MVVLPSNRDGTEKKWPLHVYVQKSVLDVVTSLYEPYLSFSSAFVSSKTVLALSEGIADSNVD